VTDIGIIGAGRLGQAMARVGVRASRSVVGADDHHAQMMAGD
jgi:predicted dinucleotide-binding enzyme